MTLKNIHNRPDWFIATHTTPYGKYLHATAYTRLGALTQILAQIGYTCDNGHIHEGINYTPNPMCPEDIPW